MKRNEFFLFLYFGFISIAGLLLILWITPSYIGVNPDSTTYLNGAKSLFSGKGYSENGNLITLYPPLFSLFLAVASFLNTDLVQTTRYLNACLFGIDMALVAAIVYRTAGRNFFISTIAVVLLSSFAPILFLYSWVWSEPLFITLTLVALILLTLFVQKPSAFLLIASSICFGLLLLTRYIGLAFLPAAMIIIFIGGNSQDINQRIRNALFWAILSCSPLGYLIISNMVVAGSATNRSIMFHPVSQYVLKILTSIFYFLSPTTLPISIRVVLFGFLLAMVIAPFIFFLIRHPKNIQWKSIEIIMAFACYLFSFSYLILLYISISFFDVSTPPDLRIMSPIFLIIIVGLFPTMWVISQALNKRILWWSFLLIIAITIFVQIPEAIRSSELFQTNGFGNTSYTSRQWQESESIAFIRLMSDDLNLYSNGPDAIRFLTSKQSISIPQKYSSTSTEVNLQYTEEITRMCKDITENGAFLIYFKLVDWKWHMPDSE